MWHKLNRVVGTGRGSDLMRVGSSRRRTKQELVDSKRAEEEKEQQYKDMYVVMEKLQADNVRLAEQLE